MERLLTVDEEREFQFLWDGSSADWVLYSLSDVLTDEDAKYVIYDRTMGQALIIEDDELNELLINKMVKEGAPTIH